jgi:hypothetical protein
MSKLASISSSPTLREYSQGAAQSMTSAVADFIAGTVPVATSTGYYKKYTAKHRFRIPDTRRALGGTATRVGFSASDETFNCAPHALDFPVDNLEKLESADLENIFQEGADMIAEVASLAHEKTVIDKAIEAVGAGTALSIGANDDIIKQLDQDILAVIKAAKFGGLMGVGVLVGAGAWAIIKNHASVRNRFVAGGKQQFANLNINQLGELLIAQSKCAVSLLCYDTAPEGLPEDIEFILDGDVLVFARRDQPTRRDPSFMKTFRLRGQFMVPGSYQTEDGRGEVAKFDWSEDVQVTNAAAAIRRTVALT